jgi:hypothetical protein
MSAELGAEQASGAVSFGKDLSPLLGLSPPVHGRFLPQVLLSQSRGEPHLGKTLLYVPGPLLWYAPPLDIHQNVELETMAIDECCEGFWVCLR